KHIRSLHCFTVLRLRPVTFPMQGNYFLVIAHYVRYWQMRPRMPTTLVSLRVKWSRADAHQVNRSESIFAKLSTVQKNEPKADTPRDGLKSRCSSMTDSCGCTCHFHRH